MNTKTPITDPRDVAKGARIDHGLDPEEERHQTRRNKGETVITRFALARELPTKEIEWHELQDATIGTNETSPARIITIGGNTSIKEVNERGFFSIQSLFEKTIAQAIDTQKDESKEILQAAQEMAKAILKDILPPQAFLFVPPEQLAMAQLEAEKLARDFAKECINAQKIPDKDAMQKHGKSGDLKSRVGKKLRSLSLRHDGRMHTHPFSSQYAPETGIAPVATIETRHQSITGDHGRARMGTS